ncbi:hypothetical protein AAFF_G00094580 [Aldrovandia affinis]|uniref:Interleukin-7 n=1 Tax=Aldrovandia affinis TaxID=143900 RepID=A0AAD7T302_9TELE|nr:hypothetical protein AAFF_G00094580 [Aldrovandia affinis]
MTDVLQQPPFGYCLLALLLLPVVHSCESTKPMAGIKADYSNVIFPLLRNIENNITNLLADPTKCGEIKKKHACEENNETRSIHKMVCSIPFKNPKKVMSKIKCDLKTLTVNITDSLECYCPTNEDDASQSNCAQPQHRNLNKERLCKLLSLDTFLDGQSLEPIVTDQASVSQPILEAILNKTDLS